MNITSNLFGPALAVVSTVAGACIGDSTESGFLGGLTLVVVFIVGILLYWRLTDKKETKTDD